MQKYLRIVANALTITVTTVTSAWSGCMLPAGALGSNPNSRYVISLTKQEVYDTQTNITWQRCPYNWYVTPDGTHCIQPMGGGDLWSQRPAPQPNDLEGVIAEQLLGGPLDLQKLGWYIPDLKALGTLVDRVCKNPAINQEVFPDTPALTFWTSSGAGTNSHRHRFFHAVQFAGDGRYDEIEDWHSFNIRLMYRGKSPAILVTLERNP